MRGLSLTLATAGDAPSADLVGAGDVRHRDIRRRADHKEAVAGEGGVRGLRAHPRLQRRAAAHRHLDEVYVAAIVEQERPEEGLPPVLAGGRELPAPAVVQR